MCHAERGRSVCLLYGSAWFAWMLRLPLSMTCPQQFSMANHTDSYLAHIQHGRRHSLRIEPAIEIEVLLEEDRGDGQKIDAVVNGALEGKGPGTVAQREPANGNAVVQ